MVAYLLILVYFLAGPLEHAAAEDPFQAGITLTAGVVEVSWPSRLYFRYTVEISPDLQDWTDLFLDVSGNGLVQSYIAELEEASSLFFRVRESGFLLRPLPDEQVTQLDGVAFAFNLHAFPSLPAKLRVYQRTWNSGAAWTQIGQLTDLTENKGEWFVRGSAVWVPQLQGSYEIMVEALDPDGLVLADETRRVIVGQAATAFITITGGPPTPSATPQNGVFTTEIANSPSAIRRVGFYDNGVFVGQDWEEPFGDAILNVEGQELQLLRGVHNITAKAYDDRGVVSAESSPFVINITGGAAAPSLTVNSPLNGITVVAGDLVTVSCTVTDADGIAAISSLTAYDLADKTTVYSDTSVPFNTLSISTIGWSIGPHTLSIVAKSGSEKSYPRFLTLIVKSAAGNGFAESLTAKIVDEATAAVSNISFFGMADTTKQFNGGVASGLDGINSGVVMTTGKADIWNYGDFNRDDDNIYGLDQESREFIWNAPGDAQLLDRAAGTSSYDAAVLEFDVFCTHGQLEMEYQFGSEEYLEYVGDFNDAFMVTVDDVPVSLLPDASGIVAVNTVNGIQNQHLFRLDDMEIEDAVLPANQSVQVEYDGMTVRLRIHAFVTPGQNHHVRIVIADINDARLDSALFIKEGSVRTTPVAP